MNLLDKVFSGKPSRADFAEMIVQALHKAGINTGIKRKDRSVRKRFFSQAARRSHNFSRQRLRQLLTAPRSARQSILSDFITAAASIPDLPSIPSDFATVKPSLMPVIRDAAYFSMIQLLNRKNKNDQGVDVVLKNLAGGLAVGLGFDTKRNITSINRDVFEQWRVTPEEALKAAKDNLWERTDPNRFAGRNGVYWGEWPTPTTVRASC